MARLVLFALAALVITAVSATAHEFAAGSSWRNQRGAVLTIAAVDAKGMFQGSFENKAIFFQCQDKFDVAGTVRRTQVIFYVVFKNARQSCDMMAVWRGSVRGTRLSVQWDIAYANKTTGRLRFLKGSDIFHRK